MKKFLQAVRNFYKAICDRYMLTDGEEKNLCTLQREVVALYQLLPQAEKSMALIEFMSIMSASSKLDCLDAFILGKIKTTAILMKLRDK